MSRRRINYLDYFEPGKLYKTVYAAAMNDRMIERGTILMFVDREPAIFKSSGVYISGGKSLRFLCRERQTTFTTSRSYRECAQLFERVY